MASHSGTPPPGRHEGAQSTAESPKVVLIPEGLDDMASATNEPFTMPRKGSLVPVSNRDSRASFASTNRTSTADSVFSNGRISTVSVSTSVRPDSVRQSSLDSGPPSAISPWETERRKDSFDSTYPYFCTFCDLNFLSKTEWWTHELVSHGSEAGYCCRACGASYSEINSLVTHLLEAHHTGTPPPGVDSAQSSGYRRAWGCGFCAATISSHTSYLHHISNHFDEGKERVQWQQVLVIKALLHQPVLRDQWDKVIREQEAVKGAKLRFSWDDQTSLMLQSLLEYFAPVSDNPRVVAELACALAESKPETNISGQYGDFSRLSKPHPGDLALARLSEDIVLSPDIINSNMASALDQATPVPTPASLPPHPSRAVRSVTSSPSPFSIHLAKKWTQSPDSTRKVLAKIEETSTPPPSNTSDAKLGQPETNQPRGEAARQATLRRVESDWNLALLTPRNDARSAADLGLVRPRTASPYRAFGLPIESVSEEGSHDHGQMPLHGTTSELPRDGYGHLEEWHAVPHARTTSSRRTPSGSSFLSMHTVDQTPSNDNSASDYISDDSLSEPDSWLEFNCKSESTRLWARAYHQKVERIMDLLWERYNHDLDALINMCVGEQSSHYHQVGETRGRAQESTQTHYSGSYSLQPNIHRRISDERDDDDEMEGHRPTSSQSKRSSTSPKQRYACPFRKHDPEVYNIHDHDICALRSWESVSRMKEHLYRKHCKIYCQRCKQIFRRTNELESHEMRPEGCEVRRINPPADITAKQEKQLKSKRYATRYQTEEEKWAEVYRLLFPGERVPSPYPELAPDIRPVPAESRNNLNFQLFLLSEMPQIFRQTAATYHGRYLEDNESLTMDSINTILKESINQAFHDWESTGGSVPRQFTPNSILQNSSITTSPSLPMATTQTLPITSPEGVSLMCQQPVYEDFQQQPQQTFPSWQEHLNTLPLNISGMDPFENEPVITAQQAFPPTTSFGMSGFHHGYNPSGGNDAFF